jgi:hypothetical protein
VIVMGAPQQGPDTSFIAYRQAIEIAEAARQRAIAAALADYRRALQDIEAAYRRELAAARCHYSHRPARRPGRRLKPLPEHTCRSCCPGDCLACRAWLHLILALPDLN